LKGRDSERVGRSFSTDFEVNADSTVRVA
jgi:hypothetical protein